MSDKEVTVKYDFNWFLGGIHLAGTIFIGVLAIEFLDTVGAQREMFEAIGKWGSLIEDGFNAQREVK